MLALQVFFVWINFKAKNKIDHFFSSVRTLFL